MSDDDLDRKEPCAPGDLETAADADAPRDRARRRLLKLGVYAAPVVLGMTSFIGKSYAQASPKPSVAAGAAIGVKAGVKAKAGVTVKGG